ncbi:MAG: SGNH/GDSL hydrolase family protein [Candidatus Krumholzibacteriota bacterium]|nr:SGNH/GDSL hydrolase family protein [Candidatus Krumholzibacteriota bacterium]
MVSPIKRHPKTTLVLFNLGLLVLLLVLIEAVLKICAPFNIPVIGHQDSANADRYGWGYSPHEQITLLDPDTGRRFASPANNHGWRDRDRQYANLKQAYRILVLGDSNTFGAVVPADKMYTRLVEKKLLENGYNAEVINISYGGWGTDQELEALIREGLSYKPNLIIVQFCANDLEDNAYFEYASRGYQRWANHLDWKPFYYALDSLGCLHRCVNPYFNHQYRRYRKFTKKIISHSEMLKRLYAVYLHCKFRNALHPDQEYASDEGPDHQRYRITRNQLLQLQAAIGLEKDSGLYRYLEHRLGQRLGYRELCRAVESSVYCDMRSVLLKILEERWFHDYWSPDDYLPLRFDAQSYEWNLYISLMQEMKKRCAANDAKLAVLPENEEGHYRWDLAWHRISGDSQSRENYWSLNREIRKSLRKLGIDVIENTQPYTRAHNDPHPNTEGNEAMAEDLWKYLMRYRKHELDIHKKLAQG